jgi:hypothetical protein
MPGGSKTAQAIASARCLEDSLHAFIIAFRPVGLQDNGRGAARSMSVVAIFYAGCLLTFQGL